MAPTKEPELELDAMPVSPSRFFNHIPSQSLLLLFQMRTVSLAANLRPTPPEAPLQLVFVRKRHQYVRRLDHAELHSYSSIFSSNQGSLLRHIDIRIVFDRDHRLRLLGHDDSRFCILSSSSRTPRSPRTSVARSHSRVDDMLLLVRLEPQSLTSYRSAQHSTISRSAPSASAIFS